MGGQTKVRECHGNEGETEKSAAGLDRVANRRIGVREKDKALRLVSPAYVSSKICLRRRRTEREGIVSEPYECARDRCVKWRESNKDLFVNVSKSS